MTLNIRKSNAVDVYVILSVSELKQNKNYHC